MTAHATELPARRPREAGALRRYLCSLPLGAVLAVGLLVAMLKLLALASALPPPQISNNLCLDEKLAFMRAAPPRDPNLLVVGSSVAWRHFNSPEAVRLDPAIRPYNAGLCGASIAQTEAVTRWLLGRLPSVKEVLWIASPNDFSDCSATAPSTFDVGTADRYVFGRKPTLLLYFDYFDPRVLLANAVRVHHDRYDSSSFDSLVMNRYGDGPLEPKAARELEYGALSFDPACFDALRRVATDLTARQVRLRVALNPVNPLWRTEFDPSGHALAEWEGRVSGTLAGTTARLDNLDDRFPTAAFFDAIHLRWSYTPQFTSALIAAPPNAPGAQLPQAVPDKRVRL